MAAPAGDAGAALLLLLRDIFRPELLVRIPGGQDDGPAAGEPGAGRIAGPGESPQDRAAAAQQQLAALLLARALRGLVLERLGLISPSTRDPGPAVRQLLREGARDAAEWEEAYVRGGSTSAGLGLGAADTSCAERQVDLALIWEALGLSNSSEAAGLSEAARRERFRGALEATAGAAAQSARAATQAGLTSQLKPVPTALTSTVTAGLPRDEARLWREARDVALAGLGLPRGAGLSDAVPQTISGAGAADAATVESLLAGRLGEADLERLCRPPALFLFLSSTFVDSQQERNYFHERLWPELSQLCAHLQIAFEVVDLRWGVSDAITQQHATTELCLGEVARCAAASAGPCFIFLSGERYGWRALPHRVPAAELTKLAARVHDPASRAAIDAWWRTDANALPEAEAVLRSLEDVARDASVAPHLKAFFGPTGAEAVMAAALRAAAAAAVDLPPGRLDEWTISVTHKEVRAAVDAAVNPRAPRNLAVLQRTLVGLREAATAEAALAEPPARSPAALFFTPPADVPLLEQLRAEALQIGAGGAGLLHERTESARPHIATYQLPWRGRPLDLAADEDATRVRAAAAGLFAHLAHAATSLAGQSALSNDVEREAAAHARMAAARAREFFGRAALRRAAQALFEPSAGRSQLRVVQGPSGAGKTSLLAAAASEPHAGVSIFRFCGTSRASSAPRPLLASLCGQISRAYHGRSPEDAPLPGTLEGLAAAFSKLLAECASADRPLRIAIDSIDQLTQEGKVDVWRWLPRSLPPHAVLVVSCIADERFRIWEQLRSGLARGPDGDSVDTVRSDATLHLVAVGPVEADEAAGMVAFLLASAGRRLTGPQAEDIATAAAGEAGGAGATALQLRLLAGEAAQLRSWEPPLALPDPSVPALIARLYVRLESEHGERLVRLVLGQLARWRAVGRSAQDLLADISADDSVLGAKGVPGTVFQFCEAPDRKCPPLVFARLRRALGEFVVERAGPTGEAVFAYFHRQFSEAADRRYLQMAQAQPAIQAALVPPGAHFGPPAPAAAPMPVPAPAPAPTAAPQAPAPPKPRLPAAAAMRVREPMPPRQLEENAEEEGEEEGDADMVQASRLQPPQWDTEITVDSLDDLGTGAVLLMARSRSSPATLFARSSPSSSAISSRFWAPTEGAASGGSKQADSNKDRKAKEEEAPQLEAVGRAAERKEERRKEVRMPETAARSARRDKPAPAAFGSGPFAPAAPAAAAAAAAVPVPMPPPPPATAAPAPPSPPSLAACPPPFGGGGELEGAARPPLAGARAALESSQSGALFDRGSDELLAEDDSSGDGGSDGEDGGSGGDADELAHRAPAAGPQATGSAPGSAPWSARRAAADSFFSFFGSGPGEQELMPPPPPPPPMPQPMPMPGAPAAEGAEMDPFFGGPPAAGAAAPGARPPPPPFGPGPPGGVFAAPGAAAPAPPAPPSGGWRPFDSEANAELELAFGEGPPFTHPVSLALEVADGIRSGGPGFIDVQVDLAAMRATGLPGARGRPVEIMRDERRGWLFWADS